MPCTSNAVEDIALRSALAGYDGPDKKRGKPMSISKAVPAAAFLLVVLLGGNAARADAIDGDWCHTDGRKLSINGPQIVTPGGAKIAGDYDRHHFTYVVPASEPGAGAAVNMILVSELQMRLKPPSGEEQLWRRCGKPVS
jgi:hypothetical protein